MTPQLIARIDQWPHNKRQPILLLAAARFLGAEPGPFRAVPRTSLTTAGTTSADCPVPRHADQRGGPLRHAAAVARGHLGRRAKPLALIEVGASAGLALYPDRYGYEYDDGTTVTRLAPVPARGQRRPPRRRS